MIFPFLFPVAATEVQVESCTCEPCIATVLAPASLGQAVECYPTVPCLPLNRRDLQVLTKDASRLKA